MENKINYIQKYQEGKKLQEKIYKTVRPSQYSDPYNYIRFLFNNKRDEFDDPRSEEAFQLYLGLQKDLKYLSPTELKPTIGKDIKDQYYKVDSELENDIFQTFKDKVKLNEVKAVNEADVESVFPENTKGLFRENGKDYVALVPRDKKIIPGRPMVSNARMLGNFTVSRGKDKNGEYISYADQYDFPKFLQNKMKGTPYKIYGRIYYPKKQKGGNLISKQIEDYAEDGSFLPKKYIAEKDNLVTTSSIQPLETFNRRNFGEITELKGKSSIDTRTSDERNRDYFHPIKGAVERFKASLQNETNPLIGLKNTVLPAAAGASVLTMPAVTAANLLTPEVIAGVAGNIYLGNALHSQNNSYTEAGVSVAGRILPPQLNEQAKRIGGINDLKQSKEEFKRGNIKKGLFNVATGIGGIYDSDWIPGRYDDYIDKSLELLNLAGDTNDAIKAIKKYKQSK